MAETQKNKKQNKNKNKKTDGKKGLMFLKMIQINQQVNRQVNLLIYK